MGGSAQLRALMMSEYPVSKRTCAVSDIGQLRCRGLGDLAAALSGSALNACTGPRRPARSAVQLIDYIQREGITVARPSAIAACRDIRTHHPADALPQACCVGARRWLRSGEKSVTSA